MGRASLPIASLVAAGALAGCGGGGGEGEDTAGPTGAGTAPQPRGDLIAGRQTFLIGTEPRCGDCHTLADAGATSKIASNLDELKPTFQQVIDAMNSGPGAMPKFDDVGEDAKENIAAYVEEATHRGG
jgi:cytochrome c6